MDLLRGYIGCFANHCRLHRDETVLIIYCQAGPVISSFTHFIKRGKICHAGPIEVLFTHFIQRKMKYSDDFTSSFNKPRKTAFCYNLINFAN